MVAPLVAAAGVSAVSGIYQAYQAEKARGANAKRLNELRAAFESIVPPEYDISIDDPPQYIEQSLPQAQLDFSRITPEAFQVIGQYAPEAAEFVRQQAPQTVQASSEGREGRQAQLEALREYQRAAKGENPEMAIRMQQAADRSQQEAQSRQQSALQDAQRRGMMGSGMSFATALQGAGDSMQSGAMQSQNAAIQAYRDRMNAIQTSGRMGSEISQQDLALQGRNADILNDFNARTSRDYQSYLNQRAALGNEAQRYNLDAEQRTSDRNVAERNKADLYNQQNQNRLRQQSYDNTRSERDYQNRLAESKANWSSQQKDRQNQLKRQAYEDQLRKSQGMMGIGQMEMNQRTQSTQDRNAAVGGIAGAASGAFGQQAEDDRWDKYLDRRYGKGKHDDAI